MNLLVQFLCNRFEILLDFFKVKTIILCFVLGLTVGHF